MTAIDHRPFVLPDYFISKQNELKKQIVEYADWSLKKFLTMASKQKWFDNTIFVFVADHGWSMNAIYDMPLNYHHSPLIVYAPELLEENRTFNCMYWWADRYFPYNYGNSTASLYKQYFWYRPHK